MKNLGYDTHNSIIILGSLGVMAFGLFALMFFYAIAIRPLQHFTGARYRHFRKFIFFTQIIKLTHGGYFEILVAGYLNMRHPLDTASGETTATYVAFCYLSVCVVILPALWVYALRRSIRNLNTRRFQSRFGALFDDIRKNSKWSMVYYLIFIIRRIMFCLIAFNLDPFPCL